MPKLYFLDNGLRNFIVGNLELFPNRPDVGKVSENFVFTEYFKSLQEMMRLHFWRTQNKTEVDFIYVYNEKNIYPIEVKYGADAGSVPAGIRNFIELYKPNEAVIFSRGVGDGRTLQHIGTTSILHLPVSMCGLDNVAKSFALPFHGLLL